MAEPLVMEGKMVDKFSGPLVKIQKQLARTKAAPALNATADQLAAAEARAYRAGSAMRNFGDGVARARRHVAALDLRLRAGDVVEVRVSGGSDDARRAWRGQRGGSSTARRRHGQGPHGCFSEFQNLAIR